MNKVSAQLLMIKASTFLGEPTWFKNICQIYPPTVKDVVTNTNFGNFQSVLLLSAEEIEDIFTEQEQELDVYPTPLEFLLNNCYNHKDYEQIVRDAFEFFTKEPVTFLYDEKLIWIGGPESLNNMKTINDVKILSEQNFLDFQNAIRAALGQKAVEPPDPDEDPRVKRIKAKARYRDRVKAKKGIGINLTTSLASICCMGIGITPLNVGELSYAAISLLMDTYQEKEKYDLDIRSLLAGADSKKVKPKYWIRNLED